MSQTLIIPEVFADAVNAKLSKGKHIGRREVTKDDIPQIFMRYYSQYKSKEINVTELSKLCDMSRTTVYKYIRILEN